MKNVIVMMSSVLLNQAPDSYHDRDDDDHTEGFS